MWPLLRSDADLVLMMGDAEDSEGRVVGGWWKCKAGQIAILCNCSQNTRQILQNSCCSFTIQFLHALWKL